VVDLIIKCFLLCFFLILSGCASNFPGYQEKNWYHDGYSDEEISPTIYKVSSVGRHTNFLTIQTFWLLRASDLTLEKGYDGFEILTPPLNPEIDTSWDFRVACPDLQIVCTEGIHAPNWQRALGNIHLIKGDIKFVPLRVFDAHVIKSTLDKIKDNNCGPSALANLNTTRTMVLCPHDKGYLYSPPSAAL
jgi:hypothetical protein